MPRRSLVLLAAVLACAACATAPPPDGTLYARLGGMPAIAALVDDAVANIGADRRINARFAGGQHADLSRSLADLLCERTGGPCVYRGRNMADAHEGMALRDDEFDALVEDLVAAFDKRHVPAPQQRELLGIVARMRNAIVGH